MATAAFIGLGTMGYPMAGHLASAGHEVRVFNRTRAKAEAWAEEHDGVAAATPAEAAQGADFVFTCVGADDDVRAVVYGDDGALTAMAAPAVLVDHTTASATLARELAEACAEHGIGFVDGPISGGQIGAENGVLVVMCGSDEATFARVEPVIDAYAREAVLAGPAGSGQLTKMVNQILVAGALQGAAEAINFGLDAGLDLARVLPTLTKGAANTWYLENRWETMLADEFDHGFAVDWMRKDLGLCMDEAGRIGADMPLVTLTDEYLADAQEDGDNRMDATSIIRQYRS